MDWLVRIAWVALALIHIMPAAAAFAPAMTARLYGVAPHGPLALLLAHRGALFLAVALVALLAAVSPEARRAAALVTGVSVISFLVLYARAGLPEGPLRTIATVDALALAPLAFVIVDALRRP